MIEEIEKIDITDLHLTDDVLAVAKQVNQVVDFINRWLINKDDSIITDNICTRTPNLMKCLYCDYLKTCNEGTEYVNTFYYGKEVK